MIWYEQKDNVRPRAPESHSEAKQILCWRRREIEIGFLEQWNNQTMIDIPNNPSFKEFIIERF